MRKLWRVVLCAFMALGTLGVVTIAPSTPAGAQGQLAWYEDTNIVSSSHRYVVRLSYWVKDDANYGMVEAWRMDANWNVIGQETSMYFRDSVCASLEWSSQFGWHIQYRATFTDQRGTLCQYYPRDDIPVTNHVDITSQFHSYWCNPTCSHNLTHGGVSYGYWAPVYRGAGQYAMPVQRFI